MRVCDICGKELNNGDSRSDFPISMILARKGKNKQIHVDIEIHLHPTEFAEKSLSPGYKISESYIDCCDTCLKSLVSEMLERNSMLPEDL